MVLDCGTRFCFSVFTRFFWLTDLYIIIDDIIFEGEFSINFLWGCWLSLALRFSYYIPVTCIKNSYLSSIFYIIFLKIWKFELLAGQSQCSYFHVLSQGVIQGLLISLANFGRTKNRRTNFDKLTNNKIFSNYKFNKSIFYRKQDD